MRLSRSRESELVEACYHAAGRPAHWSVALAELTRTLDAGFGLLMAEDFGSPAPPVVQVTRPADDPLLKAFLGRHRLNPFVLVSLEAPAGTVHRTDEVLPPRALVDSPFFQECLAPLDLQHALGGNLIHEPGCFAFFGFLRSPRAGPFEDDKLTLMRRLERHLSQALRLQLRLEGLELERASTLEALDRVGRGVLLLAGDGRLCFTNSAAARMLGAADGLLGDGGRLRAACREDDERLQRLLANTCGLAGDGLPRRGGTMAVRRPSGAPSWPLEILPVGECGFFSSRRLPRAAIYIADPAGGPAGASRRLLAQTFGLTPMEGRVCALLAEGLSLKAIAERLEVTHNTVRTHLAHAFDKTGARRQADLVRLLVRASPGVEPPGTTADAQAGGRPRAGAGPDAPQEPG